MDTHTPSPGARSLAPLLSPILAVLALVIATASLAVGPAHLSLAQVLSAFNHGDPTIASIVLELRLPRAILALLVGAILGAAGAALQALLQNPLAEPSLLGASNGAALGGVIALYFGFAGLSPLALPALAIAGALIALVVLLLLSSRTEGALGLILAGVAVSSLAGAGIALALNRSSNPFAIMEITFWLMGSLEDRSFDHVWVALPTTLIGLALLGWNARALDALVLGDEGARGLGVNLGAVRKRLVLAIAIGVGGAVAVAGAVGFVGLIAPHIVRPFTDGRPSRTLIPSALAGAVLVSAADVLVRVIPGENELRLGVVTAFIGAPFFLFYLFKQRRVW
jgi:iron complex transport system permease protein